MPLGVLVQTAITVVIPPVDFNSFPPYPSHPSTVVEPPRDHRRVAILRFRDCTAVAYCGGTAVMEVLLRFLYGTTAVMAVPRRCHCGHGGAAAIPLRIGPPRGGLRKF